MRRAGRARWRRGAEALATIALFPAALSGCLSPTDITLEITSDLGCSKLEGVAITAGAHGTVEGRAPDVVAKSCVDQDGGGSFGTLVLTPSSSPTSEITVRVVAGVSTTATSTCKEDDSYAGCIVVRRVTHYDDHTSLTLPIELDSACIGVNCLGEDETCVGGVCLSSKIADPSQCTGEGCSASKLFAGVAAVESKGCLGELDFTGLGVLPGMQESSFGALSTDGRVVIGSSTTSSTARADVQAFRCASFNERSTLAGPTGRSFAPTGSDGSGRVVVGNEFDNDEGTKTRAIRWSAGAPKALLSPSARNAVYGCDRDTCTVFVGSADSAAVFWRSPLSSPTKLQGPSGLSRDNIAYGVDPKGEFAFGTSSHYASVWTLSNQALQKLGAEDETSVVSAATPNGEVLAGYTTLDGDIQRPVLWKAGGSWMNYKAEELALPAAAVDECSATAISDNGEIVTGSCDEANRPASSVAVIWERQTDFVPALLSSRVAVPTGWRLSTAYVSADGTTVAGDAENPEHQFEVYVARLK